jgi:hypothetical protein
MMRALMHDKFECNISIEDGQPLNVEVMEPGMYDGECK